MTANPSTQLKSTWQQELTEAFTNIDDLCRYLKLDIVKLPISKEAAKQFPLKVPKSFADCMKKSDANDPLLLQVLPVNQEMITYPGFSNDPVGDLAAATSAHVLHKYKGRVLLINTGACAINCRYCFRRNFPYAELQLNTSKQDQALSYIREDSSIHEVILSGGDPLLLSDAKLAKLFTEFNTIPHLKRIRIHSRLPIVLPSRINSEFIKTITHSKLPVIMVVHCNHPNEISTAVINATQRLHNHGITLFNQAVLLRKINDKAVTLIELSEKLFAAGVLPYYLHLLDKAHGTGHFEVPESEALRIMKDLMSALPGYLVPKLIREVAGAPSKQMITGA